MSVQKYHPLSASVAFNRVNFNTVSSVGTPLSSRSFLLFSLIVDTFASLKISYILCEAVKLHPEGLKYKDMRNLSSFFVSKLQARVREEPGGYDTVLCVLFIIT